MRSLYIADGHASGDELARGDDLATVSGYAREAWRYRRFWWSLAVVDLRNRFRRSKLGLAWVMLQPLLFTLLLSLVLQHMFNQPFVDLSLYIFPGLVLWAWVSETVLVGATSFQSAEGFIRQKRLPLVIYAARTLLLTGFSFVIAMVGVLAWCVFFRQTVELAWLLLLPHAVLIAAVLLPAALLAGFMGTLYRDFVPAISLALQALWFISPVFIDKAVFANDGLREWDRLNPVSNMLELMRIPLLEGGVPPAETYLILLACAVVLSALAAFFIARFERTVVYRL